MLMNNLDPEVAERPQDLVVYGGTGRAARSWEAFDAIVRHAAHPRRRRDAARAVGQAGRRVSHARVGAARADRQLQPRARVGDVGRVPPARGARADDVRPDDRRVVDLHRQPGHRAGHLRVLRRDRAPPLRRLAGRHDHADRRPRRHGRRAAARRDHERRRGALRRGRPRAHRAAPARPATWTSWPTTSTTPSPAAASAKAQRRALSVGLCANAADVLPALLAAGLRGRHRHRPDQRARPAHRLRPEPDDARGGRRAARRRPRRVRPARAAPRSRPTARRWSASWTPAPRSSTTATACAPRRGSAASSARSPTPASSPPTSARCSARARARSAGWRSPATRPTSPPPTARCSRSSPTTRASPAGSAWRGERIAFQGLPARICWLGYGERDRLGLRFNEMVRSGELRGADRDRPRPPRLGLGRLALPRDRGDGGRVRRDRRLAAAERARQHRRRARPG